MRWAVGIVAWLLLTLWVRPLAIPDEGRYAGVAWEMLRSGHWLVPTLDGMPYFHKPPLFYWLAAASMQGLGVHPWSARLASVLGALLMIGALHLLVRRQEGDAAARRSTLVLASMPFLVGGSQFANLDMLVAGCITASVCAGIDGVLQQQRGQPHRRQVLLACVFAAIGVLAKGLIGVVLPAAALGLWLLSTRRWRGLRLLLWWPAWGLAIGIALPWFVLVERQHPGFLHYFFVVQHFQRFLSTGFNNVQPFWFYPVVLAGLGLPWTMGVIWWRRAAGAASALGPAMACWALVIVVFFSLPQSKLVGYVLPALPPLAYGLSRAWHARWGDVAVWRLAGLSALLSVAGIVAVARHDTKSAQPLATALLARHVGEPLLIVGGYPFDLPLLLGEQEPLPVFLDWRRSPELQRDSWGKELADAGSFAPDLARRLLRQSEDLGAALCAASVNWIVLAQDELPAELRPAVAVVRTPHLRLLRLDLSDPARRQAACPQTPSRD